jgi:hypothetical protein
MRRSILAAVVLLGLTACASDPAPAPQPPPAAPPPTSTHAPAPRPRPATDMCGAYEVQDLVGRPRSEVPVPVLPALQRVACTTCPVTMDYNPKRLNFLYDAETGIIKEVKCG